MVNTATKCGHIQFEGLEHLRQVRARFSWFGIPIYNQFAGQELETNDTIETSCQMNHGVTFQLMAKCDVNGAVPILLLNI